MTPYDLTPEEQWQHYHQWHEFGTTDTAARLLGPWVDPFEGAEFGSGYTWRRYNAKGKCIAQVNATGRYWVTPHDDPFAEQTGFGEDVNDAKAIADKELDRLQYRLVK